MSPRWIGLIVIAGMACSKSQPAKPAETAKPAEAASPSEAASTADRLIASMTEYVMTLAAIPFTGDCVAWSNAALKAEPIMLSIQDQMKALASNPERDAIKSDVQMRAPAAAEDALKMKGMTMAHYEELEQRVHSTCRGNAAYEAAMPRIAMKRQAAPTP
jgi:hypothetical protein